MIIEIVCGVAAGYQLFAVVAALAFERQRPQAAEQAKRDSIPQPVSVLKPVHGIEPSMRKAIASHTVLHGDYEFLCGTRADDPAIGLISEFPKARVVESTTLTPNRKVGVLMDLEHAARNPVLVVNDADIRVGPDYLEQVTGPLRDPGVGMVTCLYRVEGDTFAARFEGLGIATDFAPSTLVARLAGVDEFAMGSTMAFRRTDLERIGGFASIADFLADDYQLGQRIHALGLRCILSPMIVTTQMGGDLGGVWQHQVRWARTIRISKFWGYLGLPVTFASFWAVVAAIAGAYPLALGVLACRMLMATVAGWVVLRSPDTLRLWVLIPLRDLFGAAVWAAGLFGKTVVWRDRRLQVGPGGRILA